MNEPSDAGSQSDIIEFVTSPAAFDQPSGTPVERIDTHISIVAMCGDRVLKLKRSVLFSFLDFSTPQKRKVACDNEIKVNRRTAPNIYQGVKAVTRETNGGLALDGKGEPVDYVVVMRRFDQEGLFDRMAKAKTLTGDMLDAAVDAVAELHTSADVRTDQGGAGGLGKVIDENLDDLARYTPAVFAANDVDKLASLTRRAFADQQDLLEERRVNGRVRHGHGDLHLRNICLVAGRPTLFDAIEFNDRIACCDVLYDVAFLVMDLISRDLDGLANRAINRYLWRSGDWRGMPAFWLFLCCRATVRAKTSAISADAQQDEHARDELIGRAKRYLALATRCLQPIAPRLIAIGGLSGSGKSTLANALAPDVGPTPGAITVRSDVLRKQLFNMPFDQKLPPTAYDEAATARVYAELGDIAGRLLDGGWPVIADAVFGNPAQRRAIETVATSRSVNFIGMWLDAPTDELIGRVSERRHDASDADAAVVRSQSDNVNRTVTWQRMDASGTREATVRRANQFLADNPKVVSDPQES